MKKYLVLYSMPHEGLKEWQSKPKEETKAEEDRLMQEWQKWMQGHGSLLTGATAGIGKPKRVTKDGIEDTSNDIMLYDVIEAESPEVAAEPFKNHPHLQIPGAWIEIMPINPLPGMEG